MATWNLHVVGQKAVEDVDAIAAAIVKALEDAGHQLVSATLTTDEGVQNVGFTPAPEEPEPVEETPAEPATEPPTAPAEVPTDTPPTVA